MLYTTINTGGQLLDEFVMAKRGDSFSLSACDSLIDYFEDFGEDIEVDAVAICCEFSEMSISEIIDDYQLDLDVLGVDDQTDNDDLFDIVREHMLDEGYVVLDGKEDHLVIGA